MLKQTEYRYKVYKSEFVSGSSDIHKDKMVRIKMLKQRNQFISFTSTQTNSVA